MIVVDFKTGDRLNPKAMLDYYATSQPDDVFKIGDRVRVAHDRTYFSTLGIDMVVTRIQRVMPDGEHMIPIYHTNRDCPVHGGYNDFELVKID